MTWYQIIGACIASCAFGYMIGMFKHYDNDYHVEHDNHELLEMNKSQKARGDYWLIEYQKMILQHEDSE